MRDIDADFLEELRTAADEVRADLEVREQILDSDPLVAHDQIMAATRVVVTKDATALVYKRRDPPQVDDSFETEPLEFTDSQIHILARALAEKTCEIRAWTEDLVVPLLKRIAALEDQVRKLTNKDKDT